MNPESPCADFLYATDEPDSGVAEPSDAPSTVTLAATPRLTDYDVILVNSSAGKDSQATLDVVAGRTVVRIDWQSLETFSFGDHPVLAHELVGLVLEGKKRATCWAVSDGLKGAAVGKPMVALDGKNRPRLVLKTIELTQRQFDQVDEAFAYDEGGGDRSLAYWREAKHTSATSPGLVYLSRV